mgnify:FL=1
MLEKIINILKNHSEISVNEITKDSLLIADLGLNSISVLDLICEVEEEFSIEISDRSIIGLTTVEDVQKLVEKCLEDKK